MELVELTQEQYERFFESSPYANFWQSVEMAHMREAGNDPWDVEYVGVRDDQTLKAAAALHSKAVYRGYRVYMILRGLLVDYRDEALLRFFLQELMTYLKAHKCLFVRMDPYVEYQKHLPDGSVEEGTEKNDRLIELFKSYGFEHLGFRKEIDNNYEPRWMSVLFLEGKSEDEVLNGKCVFCELDCPVKDGTDIKGEAVLLARLCGMNMEDFRKKRCCMPIWIPRTTESATSGS